MSELKLKRCPFCGGKAKFADYGEKDIAEPFEDWNVECQRCGILALIPGEEPGCVTTKEEAAEKWNRRIAIMTCYDGAPELEK